VTTVPHELTSASSVALVLEPMLQRAPYVKQRSRNHASGEDVVDFFEASSFGNFLRIVPEELRPTLRTDLAAAFDAQRGPEGVAVRDWGVLFVATRV
jgi:hypothetical protein